MAQNTIAVFLLVVGLLCGIVWLSGQGQIIGLREQQQNINREIGLWTSTTTIAQTFRASQDQLCRIDLYLDSYNPLDSPYLDVRLFELPADTSTTDLSYAEWLQQAKEIRHHRINGWLLSGHMFNSWVFAPIPDSGGKYYLVSLQSPALTRGGSSILLGSPEDTYPYHGHLFVDGEQQPGDLAFRAGYAQPRTVLIQKAVQKLRLQKPWIFSHAMSFYVVFGLYAALLCGLFASLLDGSAVLRAMARVRPYTSAYRDFLLLSSLIPVTFVGIGFRRVRQSLRGGRAPADGEGLAVLVIQLQKIGDLVCTTPVFRELRARFPKAHIAVMVLPFTQGILTHNPYIDDIIPYDPSAQGASWMSTLALARKLSRRRFDWSLNFSPSVHNLALSCLALIPRRIGLRSPHLSGMTRAFYWTYSQSVPYNSDRSATAAYLECLRPLGIDAPTAKREIFVNPADRPRAQRFFQEHDMAPTEMLIALHPFAGVSMKAWGGENFARLAERLVEDYAAAIVIIGADQDASEASRIQKQTRCQVLNACGRFTLAQLPALLERCALLISVDTGPLYMADALGVPVVDIAGPCDMQTQSPLGLYAVVQDDLTCIPCSFIMNGPRTCRRGDRACITRITVDAVLNAVKQLEDVFLTSPPGP